MDTITLDEIYDYLDQPHRYTSGIWSLCPFHDDHSPSFKVSEKGYICNSCGARGSLRALYQYLTGTYRPKPKSKVNPHSYVWTRWLDMFGDIKTIARIAHQNLIERPELGSYLEKRKIDSFIEQGGLGYLEGYYSFPVKNEYMELVGIQLRASPTIQNEKNRYLYSPHCPLELYVPDWMEILKNDTIYLTYGTIDSVSLLLAGYPSMGSSQSQSIEHLTQRKLHYGIPDFGEEKTMLKQAFKMGWRLKVLKIKWPDGCKDINDIHVKYGLDKIKEVIEKSKETHG